MRKFFSRLFLPLFCFALLSVASNAFAAHQLGDGKGGTLFIYTQNDSPGTAVTAYDDAQYLNLGTASTTDAIKINTRGMDAATFYNTLNDTMAKYGHDYANVVVVNAGHGVVGGLGLGGVSFTKDQVLEATNIALERNGLTGGLILDCCGSGDLSTLSDINKITEGGKNVGFVFMSSAPGRVGWTPDLGDDIANVLTNFKANDTNNDGILTAGEVTAALAKHNKVFKPLDPDAPFVFENKEKAEEWLKKKSKYCPVVTPGQSNGKDSSPAGSLPNYGPIDPDDRPEKESDINRELRTAPSNNGKGYDRLKANIEKDIASIGGAEKVLKWTIPTIGQAKDFIDSSFKFYKVNGKQIQPGPYRVGQMVISPEKEKLAFDINCNLIEKKEPDKPGNPGANPNGNNGNPGNNGSNNQQQNALSQGLQDALKKLLGQQQQNQNQQNNLAQCGSEYNPVCGIDGRTYPNQCVAANQARVTIKSAGACTSLSNICPTTFAPVCGVDGTTYPNQCTAETINKIAVAKQGQCATLTTATTQTATDLASSTNMLATIIKLASQSGASESVLSSIIRTLTQLITGFMSSAGTGSEVIVP